MPLKRVFGLGRGCLDETRSGEKEKKMYRFLMKEIFALAPAIRTPRRDAAAEIAVLSRLPWDSADIEEEDEKKRKKEKEVRSAPTGGDVQSQRGPAK